MPTSQQPGCANNTQHTQLDLSHERMQPNMTLPAGSGSRRLVTTPLWTWQLQLPTLWPDLFLLSACQL
ncbi:MAG: hypothetical protein MI748_16975, partial [Opitutales bacterium]|nr:hypothetical protein [Opitutales bacterium]